MIGAALRRRVTTTAGYVDLRAVLAGGLAALVTAGQAMGAMAPMDREDQDHLQRDSRKDDEDKDKNEDNHDTHHDHDRGGRPAGYRHDRDPKPSDSEDAATAPTDSDAESTDGEATPTEGDAAPTEGEPAPAYDDASGGDNVQEGAMAPAASPVPESIVAKAPPVAGAPNDVEFVS